MRRSERELFERTLAQLEALAASWAEERKAERAFIEDLERRHGDRVERLLSFITAPEQAAVYARARELEVDDFVRKTGGSEFDELPLSQADREANRRFVREELGARGVTEDEIAAAIGS